MTRDEVLREFHRPYQSHEDVGGPDADSMADEIVRLRKENDALHLRVLSGSLEDRSAIHQLQDANLRHQEVNDRLRRILAALREPSGKVIRRMTQRTIEGLHHVDIDIVLDAIRVALPAAVEAAEQEASA